MFEALTVNVNWLAVIVGAVVAYALGALWYSQAMFGTVWMKGAGLSEKDAKGSMAMPMIAQAVGTFGLAWVIGITETTNALGLAILIALTIAVLIKANGLFAHKSRATIAVESGFVIAMAVVMILAQAIF